MRGEGFVRRLLRNIALALFIVLVAGPVVTVLLYRFIPPPVTPLMVIRAVEGRGLDHRWKPIDKVAPALPRALIAAEDAKFCDHRGFDFDALQKAYENNESGRKIRGGSTISQQTAKNVFLWPGRSYVRKGLEAWFTVLIETFWGKKRIMEVYLNSIEYGSGIYGAEAAAQRYFGVGADQLTQAQAARLAAILPSPLKWKVVKPGRYVAKRSKKIGKASGAVRRGGLAECVS
ncbi:MULTISPECIES: monofunctional biosynthetic peptidoglycan transglycosylase [unclassified Caulobacter]|uniref:monofunctional biosynthetic peptidoglycan transglycosylase n=1 Tax=unclassified Caulobacter TaxID=2648921 RepID=UPI0006F8902B|nr:MULTISPECIES: monofunctional biosynthetic peptidoglycan transglycosylase [unclassified Caulobacter]KQV62536.1 monofunctional biosynthetic peptidoglycan transglycosylase [Caulobacter sp. Root342]KQV65454.1 monofunctional biosynthetic peptidoglycan transglycosylase [Caulobacter sp. Root343]